MLTCDFRTPFTLLLFTIPHHIYSCPGRGEDKKVGKIVFARKSSLPLTHYMLLPVRMFDSEQSLLLLPFIMPSCPVTTCAERSESPEWTARVRKRLHDLAMIPVWGLDFYHLMAQSVKVTHKNFTWRSSHHVSSCSICSLIFHNVLSDRVFRECSLDTYRCWTFMTHFEHL